MGLLCAHLEGVCEMNFRVNNDNHVEFEDAINSKWRRPTPVDLRYWSVEERKEYSVLVEDTLNKEPERIKLES